MKYTRYDMRRGKRRMAFPIIFFILFLCLLIALSIYARYFFKSHNGSKRAGNTSPNTNTQNKNTENKPVDYIILQCGIFKDTNNLNNEKKLLVQYGNVFTIDSSEGTRVYMGIFSDEKKCTQLSKTLSDKKIDHLQATYEIKRNDICNAEIAEIINASIQIIDKLSQKDVKSYKTQELKKWCTSLQSADSKSKGYTSLMEDKKFISQLPDEINKEYITKINIFIYNQLKSVGVKLEK